MKRAATPPIFAMALAAATAPLGVAAQALDSEASGAATATVAKPVGAVPTSDLSFGTIVSARGASGEVTVSPADSGATYTGSARQLCDGSSGCQPHPARFTVTGEAGRAYRITLPASIRVTGRTNGERLAVNNLVALSVNARLTGAGQLDTDGRDDFAVGATLIVPSGTLPDLFQAQLPVIVTYE